VSASQELTYGLTSFVGSLTSLVFVKQMPNYACQFLLQLQSSALWPLDLKSYSLQSLVTMLPTVHVPVLESDGYPHSPFAGQTVGNNHGSDVMHMSPPRTPRSWIFDDEIYIHQNPTSRPSEQPSQQTLESLAGRIREHCAGLCLDCLKGKEQCRLPHPTPRKAQTFIVARPVTLHSLPRRRDSYGSVAWSVGSGAAW
jgi:hypothetical protein